jgi:hypothetical protein
MKKITEFVTVILLLVGFASVSKADFISPSASPSASSPTPSSSPSLTPSLFPSPARISFLAGPAIFNKQVAPAMAARMSLFHDFEVELGGTLSHQVDGYANASEPGAVDHVRSFGEMHLAALYPLIRRERLTIDAGLGVALGFANDRLNMVMGPPNSATTSDDHKVLPAPMVMAGARLGLTDHLGLRVDLAYLYFHNTDSYGAYQLNLNFSGLMIRPSLEWKF